MGPQTQMFGETGKLTGRRTKGFFRERAAHYIGVINALRPLREGNTRAQREFIRELAVGSRL